MKVYLLIASFILLDVVDDPVISKCSCSNEASIIPPTTEMSADEDTSESPLPDSLTIGIAE